VQANVELNTAARTQRVYKSNSNFILSIFRQSVYIRKFRLRTHVAHSTCASP